MSADASLSTPIRIGRFEVDECRKHLLAAKAVSDTDWQAAMSSSADVENPKEILEQIGDMAAPVHFATSSEAGSFLPPALTSKIRSSLPESFQIHEYAVFLPPVDFDPQSGSELYFAWNLGMGRRENFQLYRNWSEESDTRFESDLLVRAELAVPGFLQLTNAGWCNSSDRLDMEGMFLCFEHPQYETSKAVVENGQSGGEMPSIAKAIGWARSVARAVSLTHERGLRCPAIMPAGVGIREDGAAIILEPHSFPIEPAGQRNRLDLFLRSAPVAAPEHWLGGTVWAPASDLYALGCTIFFWLTARYPFVEDKEDGPIGDQHLRKTPPPPSAFRPDVPIEIDELVLQLLAKDPRDRPVSAAALAEALDAIAA